MRRTREIFLTAKRRDRVCGPHSFLSSRYWYSISLLSKRPYVKLTNPLSFRSEVKNEWSYTTILPIAQCIIRHKENLNVLMKYVPLG